MNKEDIVASEYWHIDNGGYTFSVDKWGNLEIDFGFFGYSNTQIFLSHHNYKDKEEFGIEALAKFFAEASFKLKQFQEKENV